MAIRIPQKRASVLRNLIIVGAVAGLLGGPLASLTLAQQDVIGRENQDVNDTRVTLSVTDRPLVDVVKYIREKSRVNIILAADVDLETKVTVALESVPWWEALDIVADRSECVVVKKAENLFILEQPVRITWKFQKSPIESVIEAIAKISGASIVAAPEVLGNVHLTLNNVPWRTALDTVAKSLGFVVVEEEFGILQVVHPSKLREQLVTNMYQLKYVRPPMTYRPLIKSEYTVGAPKVPTEDPETEFTVLRALRNALSSSGKLEYIDKHNMVIVKDIAPVHKTIGRLIKELDVEPAQVFVDVKFVSTTNTDALSYGVDIGDSGLAASIGGSSVASRLPFNIGSDGFGVLPQQTDRQAGGGNGSGANGVPGLDDTALAASTTFGKLDFTQMSFTLKLLKQDMHTRVVQAPKLIALDNQEATIFIGRTVRFAQTEAVEGQSGGLTFTIKEADNSPVETGFQLFMVPHVIPGTNKIRLDVIPEAETLVGSSADPNTPPGFDRFTSGVGATQVSIDLPQIAQQTLVSSMLLESGQTAVIGGLITENNTKKINKVPILGDIPVLGFFFRHEESSVTRESLIIFITPRIIRDSDTVESLIRDENQKRKVMIEEEVERIFGSDFGSDDESEMDEEDDQ
ncbi:MAG: type IV pilus assembly protein PilQ [Planctomycetota bacterium]|jgi:type IV pilus assembly protein PilQ